MIHRESEILHLVNYTGCMTCYKGNHTLPFRESEILHLGNYTGWHEETNQ